MPLLLLMGLSLVCTISCASDSEFLSREEISHGGQEEALPRHVSPTSYRVTLQPLGDGELFQHYRGQLQVNISCHEATDTIVLHVHRDVHVELAEPMVHSMERWDDEPGRGSFQKIADTHHYRRIPPIVPWHSIPILKVRRDSSTDRCEIKLKENLRKGLMYELRLEFSGNISAEEPGPFYQEFYADPDVTSKEKRWYMAVHMPSQKARRVFPCFDEKHFKATFELSIIRPEKMRAVATMPLSSTESVGHRGGWKVDHFKRTPPMSVNGLSVVIFDPRSLLPLPSRLISGGATIRGYAHPTVFTLFKSLMDKVSHMLEQIISYTGVPFLLPELHLFAIPQVSSSGSSWGIIRFSDKTLSEDFFNSFIPKDIMDQWTEYLITPNSTEDENLIKGLRVFLIYNSLKEIMSTRHLIGSRALFDRLLFYDLGFTNATYRSSATYKAMLSAMAIRMLNHTLTERTLKKALHSFILERSFKTFTCNEFFDAVDSQAWLDGVLPVAMSTSNIVKSWTDKKRFPVVTVTRNYVRNTATFEQRTFLGKWSRAATEQTSYSWWIPLTYLIRGSLDVSPFMTFGWLKNRKITITDVPRRDTFMIVNPENIGLFLVNYDETNWRLLASYLVESVSGRRQPQIPAGTRSKLLFDAIYLAEGGELDFDVALDVTLFVQHERDRLVWSTIYDVFDELKGILYDTPVLYKLLIYMRHMFAPAFDTLKGKMESETLLETGYGPLLEKARAEFRKMLDSNTVLDMSVGSLCSLFRWSQEDWNLGLKRALYVRTIDEPEEQSIFLLSRLVACTSSPSNIDRILTLVLLDSNYTFTTDEREEIMESIYDHATFIKFISHHWNLLETRFKTKPYIWNKIFEEATKDIKTQEGFELVSNFHHAFKKKMGSAHTIVENAVRTIQENVFGRYKYISVIEAWLDRQLLTLSVE